jgi:hypothetical protein
MEITLWSLPLRPVPRRLGDIVAKEGDWSQDGAKLVFVKGQDIFLANADGTGARKLLSVPVCLPMCDSCRIAGACVTR